MYAANAMRVDIAGSTQVIAPRGCSLVMELLRVML